MSSHETITFGNAEMDFDCTYLYLENNGEVVRLRDACYTNRIINSIELLRFSNKLVILVVGFSRLLTVFSSKGYQLVIS